MGRGHGTAVGRLAHTVAPMIVSVLLRLVPGAMAAGRIAGHVRVVETGDELVVRDVDELVWFLRERVPRVERTVWHEDDDDDLEEDL